MLLKEWYNRKIPPNNAIGGGFFSPTKVDISIRLLKIVSMEEVMHKIDLQFELTLEWKENKATFQQNLKEKIMLNALTDEEVRSLWLPHVIYANTDMKEAVQLNGGAPPTTDVRLF